MRIIAKKQTLIHFRTSFILIQLLIHISNKKLYYLVRQRNKGQE